MPMQAKAEGVKLFHAKAQLWALLGFVLMLLWFANSGTMYFMVAGDLLNPLDSIGFFKDVAMGSGRSGLQLVRSSQSLTVFSWLIPVNLCVAQFASERRARTDELFVSHGGRLSTLYRAKFGVVCGFYLLLQLAFYGICITITAIQMGIAPALGTVLLFCAVSVGNLLVLGAFLALASVLTLWMKNHAAAALVTSILPLAGVLLYQVQYCRPRKRTRKEAMLPRRRWRNRASGRGKHCWRMARPLLWGRPGMLSENLLPVSANRTDARRKTRCMTNLIPSRGCIHQL